ncbi:MAG: hypothetical protein PWP31_1724 [Clostridia bacterium]|nr:hypothetical protein [Clostridia bacterium]
MVEHRLAKARAAGSNPVFRSIFYVWRGGEVANAAVCKTVIRRFESGPRLQVGNYTPLHLTIKVRWVFFSGYKFGVGHTPGVI